MLNQTISNSDYSRTTGEKLLQTGQGRSRKMPYEGCFANKKNRMAYNPIKNLFGNRHIAVVNSLLTRYLQECLMQLLETSICME